MRARRNLAAVGTCAATLFLLLCGSAVASWTSTQLPGAAAKVYLLGVSCPSTSLCVASGTNNLIASSTDPASGRWKFVYAGDGPWPETESWPTNAISGKQIQGISCPSSELCVGVTDQGNIFSSTNPTGPASAWTAIQIDGPGANTHLKSISCPTTSLCVAVTGGRNDSGEVWTSSNPAGGSWQVAELGEALDLRGVSCASASLCVAVSYHGEIVVSTDPAGGAAAWTSLGAPVGPGTLQGVSCRPGLCVAGNTGGNVLTSTAAGANSWKASPGGGSVQITGSACASVSQCVVVDNNGDIITSTQADSAHPDWSFDNFFPYTAAEGNALFAASCPTTDFCTLVGSRGQILTSSDPFAAPPAQTNKGAGGKSRGPRGLKRPHTHIAHIDLKYPKPHQAPRVEATVRFYAHGRPRGYECRIDHRNFRACRSPQRYQVGGGHHFVHVRAVGSTGLRGPVATEDFWIGRHHTGAHGSGPTVGCPFPPKSHPIPGCK